MVVSGDFDLAESSEESSPSESVSATSSSLLPLDTSITEYILVTALTDRPCPFPHLKPSGP